MLLTMPPLDGVWATAPYLHNGSVPTLEAVLKSSDRPALWQRKLREAGNVKGYDLSIFDRNVDHARVMGTNKDYIDSHIPHVSRLLRSTIDEVTDSADIIVLGNKDPAFADVLANLKPGTKVVDLVGFQKGTSTEDLQGICW